MVFLMSESDNESSSIQLIVEHEEAIIAAEDTLDVALRENLIRPDYPISTNQVQNALEAAVSLHVDDDEYAIATAILNALSNSERIEQIRELGGGHQLQRIFTEWGSKYAEESAIPPTRESQGPNFWRRINSDYVIRDSGEFGLNHNILLANGEVTTITTNMRANLRLIGYLLTEQANALDEFGSEAFENLSDQVLESFQEAVSDWESKIEALEENETTNDDTDEQE